MPNVLIVEADDRLLRARAEQLLMDGFELSIASSAQQARVKLGRQPDALVLCNTGSGPETIALLRDLRAGEIPHAESTLPVLVVGADDESAAVRYYRAGADLALPADSSPLLLAAGLEALARRTSAEQRRQRTVRVGNLTIDRDARAAEVDHRPVKLTRLEFDLLQTLASEPRKVFSRAQITREVWGYDPQAGAPSRTVDSHAHRLRQKLEHAGAEQMVQTIRGVGWRLTQ